MPSINLIRPSFPIKPATRHDHIPSLMLETPGCAAWEEMGAWVAGVFWGVLSERRSVSRNTSIGSSSGTGQRTERWSDPPSCFWWVQTSLQTDGGRGFLDRVETGGWRWREQKAGGCLVMRKKCPHPLFFFSSGNFRSARCGESPDASCDLHKNSNLHTLDCEFQENIDYQVATATPEPWSGRGTGWLTCYVREISERAYNVATPAFPVSSGK